MTTYHTFYPKISIALKVEVELASGVMKPSKSEKVCFPFI